MTSSAVIAQDIQEANTILQIKWRIQAHNEIVKNTYLKAIEPEKKLKTGWITDKYYNESIMKVIGKAIADCATGVHEFQDHKDGEIVTFSQTSPEKYTRANWNAVFLYNWLACRKTGFSYKRIIQKIKDQYNGYFKQVGLDADKIAQIQRLMEDAISDIKHYRIAINLDDTITSLLEPITDYERGLRHITADINGEDRKSVLQYDCEDARLPLYFVRRDDKAKKFAIQAVYPDFYWFDNKWYIVGYAEEMHVEYDNRDGKFKRWTYELSENFSLLPQISKIAENNFNKSAQLDTEEWFEEKEKYESAHQVSETLKKYRDEIFYGLVEVLPLYRD